jgi:hypothetical protein
VCPAPRLTSWSGTNAQTDTGVHAAFFTQQNAALSGAKSWAADDCSLHAALCPVQVAEYPCASTAVTGLDAAPIHGAVSEAASNVPTYEEGGGADSSATYHAGNWVSCGADSSNLYEAAGSYTYGTGGSVMYADSSYMCETSPYMYETSSYMDEPYPYMYGNNMCMYGTGITYMDAAASLGVHATGNTIGTMISGVSSPSRETAVQSYHTTTNTPVVTTTTSPIATTTTTRMSTPGGRSRFLYDSSAAGTSNDTASSLLESGTIATESPSKYPSFSWIAPADIHS